MSDDQSEEMDQIAESSRWVVTTSKEIFEQQKTDRKFSALVTLGRAINTLRFVQTSMVSHQGDFSPAGVRARANSLLFSCAIFAECELLVRRLSRYFRDEPEFQALVDVTTRNPIAQELLNSTLRDLRNKFVFHFDIGETQRQLAKIEMSEPSVVSGMGRTNGQVHYDLSDLCAMRLLCDPIIEDGEDLTEKALQRGRDVSAVIVEFSTAADAFLVVVLKASGWVTSFQPDSNQPT